MSNTRDFFNLAYKVQNNRHRARVEYTDRMNDIEQMKGSPYYVEQSRIAKEDMETVLTASRSYRAEFRGIIDRMREEAGKRSLEAPTEAQERICRMLALKNTLSKDELIRAAKTCSNSPFALSVIDDLAQQKGVTNFRASDYSDKVVLTDTEIDNILSDIETGVDDFLFSDRKRAARLGAEYNNRHYGTPIDELTLAERNLFGDEAGAFQEIGGLSADKYEVFRAIVDGEI